MVFWVIPRISIPITINKHARNNYIGLANVNFTLFGRGNTNSSVGLGMMSKAWYAMEEQSLMNFSSVTLNIHYYYITPNPCAQYMLSLKAGYGGKYINRSEHCNGSHFTFQINRYSNCYIKNPIRKKRGTANSDICIPIRIGYEYRLFQKGIFRPNKMTGMSEIHLNFTLNSVTN